MIGTSDGQQFNSALDYYLNNPVSQEAKSSNLKDPVISSYEAKQVPPTRDLVVIRHGETAYNAEDKERGWSDIPLTDKGKEEAEKLSNLKDQPDVLISSDLKRAHDTAKIISKNSGVPLAETNPSLRTWHVGDLEGKPSSEVDNIRKKYVINPDLVPPNGESFNQFKTRVLGGIEDIMSRYNGKVGIVTHSKVQQLLNATEAGDWQHVDANHFNEKPESPGKEKTMAFPVLQDKDYDMEAAKKAGVQPDERGHYPDTFKLPTHITFSDESMYHNPINQGGHWDHVQGDEWNFTPGPANLQHHTVQELQDYFKKNEPNSHLILNDQGTQTAGMYPFTQILKNYVAPALQKDYEENVEPNLKHMERTLKTVYGRSAS